MYPYIRIIAVGNTAICPKAYIIFPQGNTSFLIHHFYRKKRPRCFWAAGLLAKGEIKKKRGRKEDFALKGAAHGFRNLSVIKIQ